MIREPFINIKRKQLLDFNFLCEMIRNNSVDKLATTFYAIAVFKEKVDDENIVYCFNKSL